MLIKGENLTHGQRQIVLGSDGQQHSGRGLYLALFSHNKYKAFDEAKAGCSNCAIQQASRTFSYEVTKVQGDSKAFNAAYNMYEACTEHRTWDAPEYQEPKYSNGRGVLWACVRTCALQQCGHYMMGRIRIGGKSITVSGPIGSDGLPLDLQECPAAWRGKLVQVPESVAAVYWANDGHNDVQGDAVTVLRKWALENLVNVK